jgi:hypothetical protein
LCGGTFQVEQDVFEVAARRLRRKDGQNVKAKCGRKLKAGQDHHLVAKFAPLVQPLLFSCGCKRPCSSNRVNQSNSWRMAPTPATVL